MNILMLPSLYHPNLGGVEVVVANLCRQFVARGHQVQIVTARWPRDLPGHATVDGISVTRLPFVLPKLNVRSLCTFPVRFLQSLLGLEKVLMSWPFDLLNLHYVSESALYAGICAARGGLPLVVSTHGSDVEWIPYGNPLQRRLTLHTLKRAAAVTTTSSSLDRSVGQLAGAALASRCAVAGNGVNVADFSAPAERPGELVRPYLLGVGRMVHAKGFDTLIRAFAGVADQYRHLDLVLVGDGVERPVLERQCAASGLAARVRFMGWRPNDAMAGVLRYAELVVIPSRREGFGIVALEAMASGKAVVAMAVGGLRELISDKVTGLLVREHTPEALAQAIAVLLQQPDWAKELGRQGRERVEARYTWAAAAERYLDIFQTVLADARRGA